MSRVKTLETDVMCLRADIQRAQHTIDLLLERLSKLEKWAEGPKEYEIREKHMFAPRVTGGLL